MSAKTTIILTDITMNAKTTIFLVVVDRPAGEAGIVEVNANNIWTPDNPGGWRYSEFGNVVLETADLKEAQEETDQWLAQFKELE